MAGIRLEGTLSKWTNVMKGWQYRYFVLDENAGLLSYYTSKEKMMKGIRRGCVRLKDAVIGIDDQEDNTFTITVDHKTFHFQAQHSDEREKWVRRLEDTIRRHANRTRLWGSQNTLFVGGYNKDPSSKRANHLEYLDKRVSEADAYLQLMIEQTNKIEKRIQEISDPEEKAKCKQLQDSANAMVDHIKHSIVTLQIAKNMAHPINGMYNGPISSSNNSMKTESTNEEDVTEDGLISQSGHSSQIGISIELGTECEEINRHKDISAVVADAITAPLALTVPDTSYSSSEGEEDFYDANDDPFTSQGSSPMSCGPRAVSLETSENVLPATAASSSKESTDENKSFNPLEDDEFQMASNKEQRNTSITSPTNSIPLQSDGSIDYDALYEEEEDTTISMESHGSMVTHLLSQVKIGMDLTKVVLPTFILERRSLLEMYADYFAHPDLFLRIADLDDPRDRIVQVCRWYMSAYHAGRKSSIAKKPYNPILGEVFQCHWDIPDIKTDPNEVKDGPVPWCRRDQLTFLAEQVSHHPPISAFYAEHYNKKISFCAHVWTKSKFLGLSIGVHNIGQGIVTLVDRNEEYFLTFPNGYGRSILTVPWIELGGSVEIQSPQTGYHANIEFLTKPFYGGKRNKITAEIYAPNERKPFVSVSGEWSGLMEAKWHDPNKNKTEVFVDVNQIPIFKKQVRPIVKQEEYESRRVWKEVTAGLKFNDIEKATKAKFEVEQRQRDEAKGRKVTEDQWEQKFFKPDGENWIYVKPLSQRFYFQEKESNR